MTIARKDEYVREMFSSIAGKYDLLNTILSFNCHKSWRKFAVEQCWLGPGSRSLDVAAGTLDLSIEMAHAVGEDGSIVALDFCKPMLDIGIQKIERLHIMNIAAVIGDAEHLPFASNSFDAAAIAFGMRNVCDVRSVVNEMARVVRPGGRVVSLELAKPLNPVFRFVYNLYFYKIVPNIGGLVNGRKEPYAYLPASLTEFCSREEFSNIMSDAGLVDIRVDDLMGGIVAVHSGTKV